MTSRSDNLPNVVQGWVVWLWDIDLTLLLGRLVIRRCDIGRIHRNHFIDQSEALLVVLVLQTLLSCVLSQTSLAVVYWLWGGRANVSVILLIVLCLDTSLQVINPMSADPNLHLPETHVPGEVRKALWREGLIRSWSPAFAFGSLAFFLPPGNPHLRRLIIACLSLRINVFTKGWDLVFIILCDHFNINLLSPVLVVGFGSWSESHCRHG